MFSSVQMICREQYNLTVFEFPCPSLNEKEKIYANYIVFKVHVLG